MRSSLLGDCKGGLFHTGDLYALNSGRLKTGATVSYMGCTPTNLCTVFAESI